MIIRRGTPEDAAELARLKAVLMRDGWPMPVDVTTDADWLARCTDVARDLLADPHYAAFVAAETDAPGAPLVGMVTVAVHQHLLGPRGTGRSAYIGDMVTEASVRGQGLGTRLLDAAMSWAREQGAGRAELYATASGRSIYERAGFAETTLFPHLGTSLIDRPDGGGTAAR